MRNGVKWTALMLGVLLLAYSGLHFVQLAFALGPIGGIPWSWSFVWLNPLHFALPLVGLALLSTALVMFVRDGP